MASEGRWGTTQGCGKRLVIGCWCGDDAYLDVMYFAGEDSELDISVTRLADDWHTRLRGAWEMLLGRPHTRSEGVMLGESDRLRLIEFLGECKGANY